MLAGVWSIADSINSINHSIKSLQYSYFFNLDNFNRYTNYVKHSCCLYHIALSKLFMQNPPNGQHLPQEKVRINNANAHALNSP